MGRREPFVMPLHRGFVQCPSCGVSMGFGADVIGKENIGCPQCKYVFSYDDGLIEHINHIIESTPQGVRMLFYFPICAGIIEIGTARIKIGEMKQVSLRTPFYKVYDVRLGASKKPTRFYPWLTVDDTMFIPAGITEKGFVIFSSTPKSSLVLKEVEIDYIAEGRDSRVEKIPIWHKFLQNVVDLIRKREYGMAIVQSVATFDAFFDNFLTKQLKNKRQYEFDIIKRILENINRRDKLYYYLYYVTGKTFEDSPFDEKVRGIAKLRDSIVHPKEYKFNEAELKEKNALEALETIIKSIRWVNATKKNS